MTKNLAVLSRSVPRSVAPVLEALELDQPTIVTLGMLSDLVAVTGAGVSPDYAARMLRERGWLLSLRTVGVWEFAPGARAGARGSGDPFIELRARLATQPTDAAVAAESAAWLQGLSTRAPDPHVIGLPSRVGVPKSLDHFRVVRWSAGNSLENRDGLPVWSVSTLFAFMGARPDRYRDWPNVSEWIADGAKRVVAETLQSELAGQARSGWARTSYLLFVGGQAEMADELLASAPPGGAPFHLGPRNMPSRYSARFEVADHVFPTWWSIKATTPLPRA